MENFDEETREIELQAEYERRVAEAVETARAEWERQAQEAQAEQRRQASLSGEERLKEREQALNERERSLARQEMKARAARLLAERRLPAALADVMCFENAEDCQKGIEELDRAFRGAVQENVSQRLGGDTPVIGMPMADAASMSDAQYYSLGMGIKSGAK